MDSQRESIRTLAKPYRKAVLTALLAFTIVAGLLFIVLNFAKGSYLLAYAEMAIVALSGFVLVAIRNTRQIERWALGFLIPFFLTMMMAMSLSTSNITVFGWALLIPILSHLLLGRHLGLLISVFFLTIAAIVFAIRHWHQPHMMEGLPIANLSLVATCILALSHVYEMARERSELRLIALAQTDALTGLGNRSLIREAFDRERSRAIREGTPLSLVLLDIDHFKAVNDKHGHEAGDVVLELIANVLKGSLRATDVAARLGGEEFGVLLANTNGAQAVDVSEKIRMEIQKAHMALESQSINVTVSGGIATLGNDGDTLRALMGQADKRMYLAKAAGRNQIVRHHDERVPEHQECAHDST